MTLYCDSSALIARHVTTPARAVAVDAMRIDTTWCASALALTEALLLIDRLTEERLYRADLEDLVRRDWDRVHVVPLDQRCLDRATQLAREQPLRLNDALHLAAADRLPKPLRFLTFDAAQIPVALSMGLDVVSL
jgi:predicted nucleic acid-binding protein